MFNQLACTRRDDDTLVALALVSSVSLHRLTSAPLRLDLLAKVDLKYPLGLLFFGNVLLVAHLNNSAEKYVIVSLRASGNALTERRVLLNINATVDMYVSVWALACERLVHWDSESRNRLLVYAFA